MAGDRNDLKRTARTFHAFADPTRLKIVEMLIAGERCVCELTDSLRVAQSRLSFHLRVLKDAGVVSDRRDGRWVYYTLVPEVLEQMTDYIKSVEPEPAAYPVRITRRSAVSSSAWQR
jgi:ArsR family transcriptional regulator